MRATPLRDPVRPRAADTIDGPAGAATPGNSRAPRPAAARRRLWPALALAFSGSCAAAWAVTAVLAADHGFDTADEGFYLLSYRWWNVEQRTFSGFQYVFGPLFQLFGHDIAALRLVRLVAVLATHLVFGWSFMRWLRLRRPAAPATRLWEAAGTATVVAAGGAVYGWLPQTPGYNDVVLLGATVALAVVLRAATHVERGCRVRGWLPAAFGALTVPVLLAKWAAAPLLVMIAVAGAVALAPSGRRAAARAAAWAVAGIAAGAGLLHLLVGSLPAVVQQMVETNRLLATGAFAIPTFLQRYWTYSLPLLELTVRQYGPLFAAAAVAVVARRRPARVVAWALIVVAAARAGFYVVAGGGLGGGRQHLYSYVLIFQAIVGFLLVTAGTVVLADRLRARRGVVAGAASSLSVDTIRGRILLGAVFLLPVLHVVGTSNRPIVLAVNGFGLWMAVLVAVLTGIEAAPVAARLLTAAVAAGAVLTVACVATGGLWRHPYRTPPNATAVASVPEVPALASVRLTAAQAAGYRGLVRTLGPYLRPGRPMMAFDYVPGVVFALGGRPVGEAWYAANDPARTAAGVLAECRAEGPWAGASAPLLLFTRPVREPEKAMLRACGLDFATDYRLLAPRHQTMQLDVYVPVADPARIR